MTDKRPQNRPLSPHLTIYRWQMSSITSILVRLSGLSLTLAFFAMASWLWTAAFWPAAFEHVSCALTSWVGLTILTASLWAVAYHSLGGIRHLIWDTGAGLSVRAADRMGWVMVIGSFALTAAALYVFACFFTGARL